MRKLHLLLALIVFALSFQCLRAQETNVQGKVTDATTGEVLPGVTISIKGTTSGTITNLDGEFKLKVPSSQSVLVFSFIGFKPQALTVGSNLMLDVKLQPDVAALEEVLVVGYGQVKKNDATGSVAMVGEKSLNKSASTSPQQMIVGKIAGVNVTTAGGSPTDGATIRIRGGSSMSASNDPLIILDGLPLDNRSIDGLGNILSSINPNEIETFTVLKDASATAIYGSRASNGVIIITTKKGAKGQSLTIDFESKVLIGTIAKKVDVLSGDEFRALINERYANNPSVKGLLGSGNTDWQDKIFQTSIGQDYSLGISSVVKKMPVRLSVGYTDQEGVLKTSEMKRYTAGLKLSPSFFNDNLKFDFGLKGIYADNRFAQVGAVTNAISFDPTQAASSKEAQYQKYGGYYTWLLSDGTRNVNGTQNPLAQLEQRSDRADVKRVIGDFKMDYKMPFLPDLRASLTAGLDMSNSDGKIRIDPSASWVELASAPDAQLNRDYTQKTKNQLVNFVLNYKKELKPIKSDIEAMVGTEEQYFWRKATGHDTRVNGTTLDDGSETENYLVSFFGRLNYTFNSRYLLTATLRRDGSSRFSPDTRWGVFPAFAFAWKVNEEAFLKNSKLVSNLKLRLGYGVTGQQDITNNDYPYMGTYRVSDTYSRYQMGSKYVTTLRPNGYDENIKWEETATYNGGLDLGFLKDRITAAVDLYYRKTDNLINTIPTPAGCNFTDRLLTNIGNLENRGIELSLNAVAIDTKQLKWDLGFNISYNKNEITKLTSYDDPTYIGVETGAITGANGNNIQVNAVGHPLNTFFVYEQKYDSNGKPIEGSYVDRNNDGSITVADKYYSKNPAPKVLMGFSSNLSYRNFDFAFSGRISLGNYLYDNVSSNGSRYQNLTTNNFLMNLPTDINTTKFTNAQFWSDYYIKDASFLKLDNITLGYNFKGLIPALEKSKINLRMYASVQNVFVSTPYKGVDPEVSSGIDNGVYPRPRTFVIGLNARF